MTIENYHGILFDMRLTTWAKKQGITYKTAWNHFKADLIPGAYKLGTGIIIVPEEGPSKQDYVVCYARVSSSENKSNLESQAQRLVDYCHAKGYSVHEVVKECASGLNDKRPKLLRLLESPLITRIVVEHSDRLSRFGVNFLICLLKQKGCEIEIINHSADVKEDLMQDFVAIITSFCARLYGLRRNKRRTEKLIRALEDENNKVE